MTNELSERLNLLSKKIEEYTNSKKITITDEQRSEILLIKFIIMDYIYQIIKT